MAAITVRGLHKTYGSRTAVDDVSFDVERGEIFGILGPNGAGKTTTVECLTGLRTPDRGELRVLGLDPRRDHAELSRQVGVQLQSAQLPEKLTVAEAIALYASFYPNPMDGDALLERLGLGPHRRVRFGKLSGGQQQRLAIALGLIGRPSVTVLDELTTGLDPQARRDTWDLIDEVRADGVTVLLVTHIMEEAERLCDRLGVIDHGRVTAVGTPRELVQRSTGDAQRITFRVHGPFDPGTLHALPDVDTVSRDADVVVVTGGGDVVLAVTAALARAGVLAHDLRVTEARLEDAFVALTAPDAPTHTNGDQR